MYSEQRGDGERIEEEGMLKECHFLSFFNPFNYKSIIVINSVNDIHSPIEQATTMIPKI